MTCWPAWPVSAGTIRSRLTAERRQPGIWQWSTVCLWAGLYNAGGALRGAAAGRGLSRGQATSRRSTSRDATASSTAVQALRTATAVAGVSGAVGPEEAGDPAGAAQG